MKEERKIEMTQIRINFLWNTKKGRQETAEEESFTKLDFLLK